MGKKLSFCDIQVIENRILQPKHEDAADEGSKIITAESIGADTAPGVVKVSFRRDSHVWQEQESPKPFPVKTSDLPYGAKVKMTLQRVKNNDETIHHEVALWQILQHPREAAEAMASQGQQNSGMLYSTYLRERGNDFAQIIKNKTNYPADYGKKRPQNHSQANQMTTMENRESIRVKRTCHNTKNDDLQGHGDKQAKAMRARLFANWIVETFGEESLQRGSGVLDIAGGKGQLSVELAVTGQIPCTVIDPLIRKQQHTFPVKRDAKRICKANGPMPRHLPTIFNQTDFLEKYGQANKEGNLEQSYDDCSLEEKSPDHLLVSNASCLIGLHPDQATQDILDIALKYNKSFAIVPCCVFPSFFPQRQLRDGSNIITYAQFIQYLLEQGPSLKQQTLPFEGRNIVIYRKVENSSPLSWTT